nr:hypothetical protein [Tanacetum cinerariifolium]
MTTPTVTSSTDCQMHNNIMAAGSKDRPPMLGTGRYPQWRSRFLRYIDTRPNDDALRKFILSGPYKPTTIVVHVVAATDDSPAIPEHTTVETPMNMSPANKAHFKSEKEAIHLILTGIGDEIYSTVVACQTAQEMWEAIERLQQGESLNIQDFRNQRTVNVDGARENVGSPIVQQSRIQCFNCKEFGHFPKECRKPKRVKDFAYHKENMLMCIQDEKGVPLQAEQYDWLADTDEDIDEQELEAHYSYMAKIQEQSESVSNTCIVETDDSNVIPDSPDMCDDDIQNDQNDVESDDERVALANLKLDVDENKMIQKQLKKENTTLAQELKECKTILAKTIKTLGKSNSDMKILIQTCLIPLALKTHNDSFIFVHELKQEMHADLKYVESFEKEIDELESDKAEFLNMYDMILQECVSNDVMCSYLLLFSDLDVLAELQCLYLHKVKECDCLAQKLLKQTESVSNEVHAVLLQRFAKIEKYSIFLEIDLQKCKEQTKNNTVWNEQPSNVFQKEREQYIKIQDLKAQLQDKNIAIILGKPTPFSDSLKRRYFSKTKSVPKTNVSEGLSKPVTAQTLPQTAREAVNNTNVLKLGMYQIDNSTTQTRAPQSPQTVRNTNPHVSTSTGVNHKTNVSRPHHRSNQLKDKVMPNNSQVKLKKTQAEEDPRISSIYNKIKSVTACNDSLNSRTLNVNAVCATCEKCLVDSDHFSCVTKMLNDVNARTKKPNVVPISTRKPKGHANKSVATHHKKKVASKSSNPKPKSYYRMLYKKTIKAWKWWIEQQWPS